MFVKALTRAGYLLTLIWCTGCQKQVIISYASVPAEPATLYVDPTQPGIQIPSDFTGLAFETSSLANGYISPENNVLVRLIKSLSTEGSLHIGGASADEIFWADKPRNGSKDVDSLYTDDVDNVFNFAKATGWRVLFGLNLAQSTSENATSEVNYIVSAYPEWGTFEIGNEPDLYATDGLRSPGYSFTDFVGQWNAYYSTIHAAVPSAAVAGPATAEDVNNWLLPFITNENTRLTLATHHYFRMGPPNNLSITLLHLLGSDVLLMSDVSEAVASARSIGLPFRIDECNSSSQDGKGVCNTLADALWGLDYMHTLAELGASGVNFYGSDSGYYSPILLGKSGPTPEPLYYGMLCFQLGSQGTIVPVTLSAPDNLLVSAYAVLGPDGSVALTIINKNASINADCTIHSTVNLSTCGYIALTATSLVATSGLTLGGNAVKADGGFTIPSYSPLPCAGDSTLITVPAGTAMIVTLH
jgi:hypothetical protein